MPTFANLDYRNCSNCSFVRSITGGNLFSANKT